MNELIEDLTDSPLKLGIVVASLAALGYIIAKGIYHGNKHGQSRVYPPGPPQDLFIGNLRQFPKKKVWGTFCKWARQYGARPCISMTTASCSFI
jgi:hypothetical protein